MDMPRHFHPRYLVGTSGTKYINPPRHSPSPPLFPSNNKFPKALHFFSLLTYSLLLLLCRPFAFLELAAIMLASSSPSDRTKGVYSLHTSTYCPSTTICSPSHG